MACSVICLALIVERFVSLKQNKVVPPRLLDEALAVSRSAVPTPDVVTQLEQTHRFLLAQPRMVVGAGSTAFQATLEQLAHRLGDAPAWHQHRFGRRPRPRLH